MTSFDEDAEAERQALRQRLVMGGAVDDAIYAKLEAKLEAKLVNQARLYATTDARVWAEEFAKVFPDVAQGTMITWFANAIETARMLDRGKTKAASDTVVLDRSALFEMLGEYALPPWEAAELTEWVETHDLSKTEMSTAMTEEDAES